MNYTIFLVILSFFLPIHSMEQAAAPCTPFTIDIIPIIGIYLDLSSINGLLRTCTAHYNAYSKGIPSKTAQRFFEHYDQLSQDDLLSVQFGIDRLLQQSPSLCKSFNEDDHLTALVHYARTNNKIMFQHIIADENTTNKAHRIGALEFFNYLGENQITTGLQDINNIKNNMASYKALPTYSYIMVDADIHYAIQKNLLYVVKLFIKNKVDLHAKDDNGLTTLQAAFHTNNEELVQYLIDKDARLLRNGNPLYYASCLGFISMVKILIKNHVIEIDGDTTSIHAATQWGHTDAVQLLLDSGIDINCTDHNKQTALHVATAYGLFEIAQMLVTGGANLNAKDWSGDTAYDVACKYRREDKFKQLLDPKDSCIIS